MVFQDRKEAGKALALCLKKYQGTEAVVLGLPRGGVVVANEVAKALKLSLDVVCPRKIGAPSHKELAIGAVCETGEVFYNSELIEALGVSISYLDSEKEKERKRAEDNLKKFRKEGTKRELQGKIAIVVDDGIATGATMKAALNTVRAEGAKKTIVAVPVAPFDAFEDMSAYADEVVIIDTPPFFQAVGQFYRDFCQVEDDEVKKILDAHL